MKKNTGTPATGKTVYDIARMPTTELMRLSKSDFTKIYKRVQNTVNRAVSQDRGGKRHESARETLRDRIGSEKMSMAGLNFDDKDDRRAAIDQIRAGRNYMIDRKSPDTSYDEIIKAVWGAIKRSPVLYEKLYSPYRGTGTNMYGLFNGSELSYGIIDIINNNVSISKAVNEGDLSPLSSAISDINALSEIFNVVNLSDWGVVDGGHRIQRDPWTGEKIDIYTGQNPDIYNKQEWR